MDVQRVSELVDAAARLLGVPVTLEDRGLRLIAYAAHGDEVDDVRRETILTRRTPAAARDYLGRHGLDGATGPVRIPAAPEAGLTARVCVPVGSGGVLYGHLWAPDEPAALPEERLTELAPLAARMGDLLAEAARGRTERGRLLRDLVAEPAEARLDAAARLSGMALLPPGRPLAIAAVDVPESLAPAGPAPESPAPDAPVLDASALAGLPPDVVVAADRTPAILLVPLAADGDLDPVHQAARALGVQNALWGIGAPRTETVALAEAWREALGALRAATADPALRPGVAWRDLGAYRLLVRLDPPALHAAAGGPAGRLIEAGDTELVRTVESYLGHGGRVQACAQELAVHRQTLYYRLEKAARVAGVDLADGDARLDLHLGLKAARLAGLGPGAGQGGAEVTTTWELPQSGPLVP